MLRRKARTRSNGRQNNTKIRYIDTVRVLNSSARRSAATLATISLAGRHRLVTAFVIAIVADASWGAGSEKAQVLKFPSSLENKRLQRLYLAAMQHIGAQGW